MAQVTVGVPVYNGAEFLEKSLACIRDQTFRDIEVLIFDNCSDDATPEIAQRFCAEDPRFRYHRQPENKGPVANFLRRAGSRQIPFFMWRAADDTSEPDYIETLLALLAAEPDRDIAVARIVSLLPDGRVTDDLRYPPRSRGRGRLAAGTAFPLAPCELDLRRFPARSDASHPAGSHFALSSCEGMGQRNDVSA